MAVVEVDGADVAPVDEWMTVVVCAGAVIVLVTVVVDGGAVTVSVLAGAVTVLVLVAVVVSVTVRVLVLGPLAALAGVVEVGDVCWRVVSSAVVLLVEPAAASAAFA